MYLLNFVSLCPSPESRIGNFTPCEEFCNIFRCRMVRDPDIEVSQIKIENRKFRLELQRSEQ
ncbi:hypothetical protein K0M31_015770 [Melipona bicolor]|uniref:Uncharacterized protein n=1 Tax=Melipona bicolor TaxID=60889 RepID=A0AA40KEW1_9HYME|nr:hypothetical protein K0M31_015770 [Melipona bicolor]